MLFKALKYYLFLIMIYSRSCNVTLIMSLKGMLVWMLRLGFELPRCVLM